MREYALKLFTASVLLAAMAVPVFMINGEDAEPVISEANFKTTDPARELAVMALNATLQRLSEGQHEKWLSGDAYSVPETRFQKGKYHSTVEPIGSVLGDTVSVTATGVAAFVSEGRVIGNSTHSITVTVIHDDASGAPPVELEKHVALTSEEAARWRQRVSPKDDYTSIVEWKES